MIEWINECMNELLNEWMNELMNKLIIDVKGTGHDTSKIETNHKWK